MKAESMRRHDQLRETFLALDACLFAYYAGKVESYRPLASQLRILLHDPSRRRDRALLPRCFENLELPAIRPIEWHRGDQLRAISDRRVNLRLKDPHPETLRVAKMPFTVTVYKNGLAVADLDLEPEYRVRYLSLDDWLDQIVTIHTGLLTIRQIILAVANKGGGAHVDDAPDKHLRNLEQLRPVDIGSNVLFIVAIGRYVQSLGAHYLQFRDEVGYDGELSSVNLDLDHPAVKALSTVDETAAGGVDFQQNLLAFRRVAS